VGRRAGRLKPPVEIPPSRQIRPSTAAGRLQGRDQFLAALETNAALGSTFGTSSLRTSLPGLSNKSLPPERHPGTFSPGLKWLRGLLGRLATQAEGPQDGDQGASLSGPWPRVVGRPAWAEPAGRFPVRPGYYGNHGPEARSKAHSRTKIAGKTIELLLVL